MNSIDDNDNENENFIQKLFRKKGQRGDQKDRMVPHKVRKPKRKGHQRKGGNNPFRADKNAQ